MNRPFQALLHLQALLLVQAFLLIVCGICAMSENLLAQPSRLDSLVRLKDAYRHNQRDSVFITLLNDIAYQFWQNNLDSSLLYAEWALRLATESEYTQGTAQAYENLARIAITQGKNDTALARNTQAIHRYRQIGDSLSVANILSTQGLIYRLKAMYAVSLEQYQAALRVLAHDSTDERTKALREKTTAKILNNIGMVYRLQGRYSEALNELTRALAIRKRYNDRSGVASLYSNIGLLFDAQQNYAESLEWYKNALTIHEELGNKQGIGTALDNLGIAYTKIGKPDSAKYVLTRALELFRSLGNIQAQSSALFNLGNLALKQQEWMLAKTYHRQSLTLRETIGDKQAIAASLIGLAETSVALREYATALDVLKRAAALADSLGALAEAEQAYNGLMIEYERSGEHKLALFASQRLLKLRDTLLSDQNQRTLAQLQAEHNSERQQQRISLLESRDALRTVELDRQRIIRNYAVLVGAMAMVLAFVAYYGYRIKRRSADQLQEQNTEILRQQHILSEQAAEIQTANTALQEKNIVLREQQHILEAQSAEIERSNTVLQEKNAVLEQLDKEKNEFLGIVAHDLKNPLAQIILASSKSLRYFPKMNDAEKQEHLRRIERVARQMTEIIKNLLDVNALEQGGVSLNPQYININDVLQGILPGYRESAAAKNITLEFVNLSSEKIILHTDEQAMIQILDNLISNAIKYSPHGKTIVIRLQSSTEAVRVEIQDEGPGISEEDMKKLFGKFARLSARPTGGEHSTGLGLSIVKKMVEAMNGKVWCESELGNGATFIVEFWAVSS